MINDVLTDAFVNSLTPIGLKFPKVIKHKAVRNYRDYSWAKKKAKKQASHRPRRVVKIKRVSLADRKKVLWELCKTYTKLRDGTMCVSCKKRIGTQCGHYLPKSGCNLVYKFQPINLGRQCSYCNLYLKGNFVGYRKHQIEKWSIKIVEEMEKEYNLPLPLNFNPRQYIETMINFYKASIKKYGHMATS